MYTSATKCLVWYKLRENIFDGIYLVYLVCKLFISLVYMYVSKITSYSIAINVKIVYLCKNTYYLVSTIVMVNSILYVIITMINLISFWYFFQYAYTILTCVLYKKIIVS